MTRSEAIKILDSIWAKGMWRKTNEIDWNKAGDAIDMAIEALEGVCFDEWCDDCKEYDTEKKCCPRFNRVIRGALNREPSEDGTLEIKVEDATKVGRVLISDDKHRGGLYYPDEDEPKGEPMKTTYYCDICKRDMCEFCVADNSNPYCVPSHYEIKHDEPQKGDLISRADAIEALGEEPLVWCDDDAEIAERNQWRADIEAIKSVPSADRPRGEWIEETSWKYKKGGRNSDMKEVLGTEWMTMTRQRCSECNMVTMVDDSILYKYCPHCGADMRGGNK